MSNLFFSPEGLRTQYVEATSANLSSATSKGAAYLMCTIQQATQIVSIDNGTDKDLRIAFLHPSKPVTSPNEDRLFFTEVGSLTAFNLKNLPPMRLDPGTKVYLYSETGAPAGGKLRMFLWG